MWHNNNDMVQRDRIFENDPIEYRNVCDTSSNTDDEASNRKLTFGIDRLLNMPTTAQRKEHCCQSFFSSSYNNEVEVYHSSYETDKCECCGKHEGSESFTNFSKLSISDSEPNMNSIVPADSVCDPIMSECRINVQNLGECSDYVSLGFPVVSDTRYSKSIRKPFPLRWVGHLGQNLFTLHHEAELNTFQHSTTTPSFIESWANDTGAFCSANNVHECSLRKEQSSAMTINKQRSNTGVPIFVKTGTQAIISRRKRSWSRAVFSSLQRKGLEKTFQEQKYITKPDRKRLAATLGLHDAQVKVWFQNRRMKWRHMVKTASIFSSSPNKPDQPSHPISPSLMSSDIPEMLAADNDDQDEVDVIID